MHLGSAKHCCSFTIFHSQFQYWLQTEFYTAYKVFARYREMPSAGNQTFGNFGVRSQMKDTLSNWTQNFGASANSLLVFLPALFVRWKILWRCLERCRRTAMCWIFARVPGFIQKEGSIFSGLALLGISWLSNTLWVRGQCYYSCI